jgi:hypothetical protein
VAVRRRRALRHLFLQQQDANDGAAASASTSSSSISTTALAAAPAASPSAEAEQPSTHTTPHPILEALRVAVRMRRVLQALNFGLD